LRSQNKRREVRVGLAHLLDQLDALTVRQGEVYDPEVGLAATHHPARLAERSCLRNHLEIGLLVEDERAL
jgi:hypothetical protein